MKDSLSTMQLPVSPMLKSLVKQKKIETLALPLLELQRHEVARRGSVFRKTFKSSIVCQRPEGKDPSMSIYWKLPQVTTCTVSGTLCSDLCNLEEQVERLRREVDKVERAKACAKGIRDQMRKKLCLNSHSALTKEINAVSLHQQQGLAEISAENTELMRDLTTQQADVEELRAKVERLTHKIELMESYVSKRIR